MKKFIIIICLLFVVQSCGPFLGTIGVVSLGAHSKQKGLGTTINDNIIKTKISNFIFKFDENLIPDTKIFVNNGSVLFTGKVKVPENKVEITKLAWSVKGVKEVNNELQVIDKSSIKNIKNILKIREEKNIPLKGEIVLVVSGISQFDEFDIKIIRESIKNKLNTMSLKDTVELISTKEGVPKKLIYKEAIKIKDKL